MPEARCRATASCMTAVLLPCCYCSLADAAACRGADLPGFATQRSGAGPWRQPGGCCQPHGAASGGQVSACLAGGECPLHFWLLRHLACSLRSAHSLPLLWCLQEGVSGLDAAGARAACRGAGAAPQRAGSGGRGAAAAGAAAGGAGGCGAHGCPEVLAEGGNLLASASGAEAGRGRAGTRMSVRMSGMEMLPPVLACHFA